MCPEMLKRAYYAILSNVGTKRKVDEINKKNLEGAKNDGKRLVILLHGMFSNYYRGMYSAIGFLRKEGIDVVSIGYNYKKSPDFSARKIAKDIERLMKISGVNDVDIIALCSGGLIARYYVEELGGADKIRKFVSVYAPVKAISHSEFGFKLNKFLGGKPDKYNVGLRKIEGRNSVRDSLLIYSEDDEIISPKYAKAKGMRSKNVRGSHILFSYSPKIFREVAIFLKEGKS